MKLDVRLVALGLGLTVLGGTAVGAMHLVYVYGLRAPSPPTHVQAHAHAQLFGFVGAFIVAFGQELLPRFVRRPLPHPRLARAMFWLLGGGAVLHFLGQNASRWTPGFWLMVLSGPLMAAAGVAFAVQVLTLLRGFDSREGFHRWVQVGAVGFAIACIAAGALAVRGGLAAERLYPYPAAQALWTIALYGGVVPFTLGVGARMALPMVFGGVVRTGPFRWALALLVIGVPLLVVSNLTPGAVQRVTSAVGHAALGAALLMAAVAFLFPKRRPLSLGADPFFSASVVGAYACLAVAGLAYGAISIATFAGARVDLLVIDAVRHVVTVGFLVLLIVGMASRLVPALRGRPIRWHALRWWAFGLLAASIFTRSAEVLAVAGFMPALRATAISGLLAWLGLVLFTVMLGSRGEA